MRGGVFSTQILHKKSNGETPPLNDPYARDVMGLSRIYENLGRFARLALARRLCYPETEVVFVSPSLVATHAGPA